jgi:non-specific serine/threonine protein kinase
LTTQDQVQRAEQIYLALRELEFADQERLLIALCGDDIRLQRAVESLISAAERTRTQPAEPAELSLNIEADTETSVVGQIGQYRIEERIGKGGMGVVYRGMDIELRRPVAIKVLPRRLAGDRVWLARLRREARILARLNHPHIAQIYALVSEDDAHYLVLELVPGRTLGRAVGHQGIPVEDTIQIGSQLAWALSAAHNRGVIHRDLKPDNVQFTPTHTAKVLDFGVALRRPRHAPTTGRPGTDESDFDVFVDSESSSGASWIAGTPGYMSPEQIRGTDVDGRADIFAYGCLLYECLTGRMVFGGGSQQERMDAALLNEPDWARLPTDTPESLRTLIGSCLEKSPADRLSDMDDARSVLDELAGGGRTPVTPAPSRLPARTNLPAQVTSFIGREQQRERLRSLLLSSRLACLAGAGGCGKTRLALELASDVLDEFADGVWVAELGSVNTPDAVGETVSRLLEVQTRPDSSVPQCIADRIRNKRVLLILDNCEHVISGCVTLCDTLLRHCPRLTVLATSQQPLGLAGEVVYRVTSLSIPGEGESGDAEELMQYESIRLLVDRARLVKPDFELTDANAAAAATICNRLDGIPLALELAAARLATISVADTAARLDKRFRLLTRGSAGGLPRHQTLEATVAWSYALLSPDEQAALARLSVFGGSWTLELARCVTGGAEDEYGTLDLVTRLVDKSLVIVEESETGSTRYRLLETVRQFARERLSESGELDATCRTMAAALVRLAKKAADDTAILRVEHLNLKAALPWCEQDSEDITIIKHAIDHGQRSAARGDG